MSAADPSSSRKAKLVFGSLRKSSIGDANSMAEQSWCNADGTTFETRIGPNYAYNKKKEPSKPCIYECVAVDLYTTPSKISHLGRFLDPSIASNPAVAAAAAASSTPASAASTSSASSSSSSSSSTDSAAAPASSSSSSSSSPSPSSDYLPPTIILNWQIPNYALENALWGQCAGDGAGYSLVFYFALSDYGKKLVAKKGKLESAADDPESEFYGMLDNGNDTNSNANTPRNTGATAGKHSRNNSSSAAGKPARSRSSSGSSQASSSSHSSSSSSSSSSPCHYSSTDPVCFSSVNEPTNSAVRLLHHFIAAEPGSDLRQRFKAITRMINVDQVGLGAASKKLVTMWNATPFLIRTCSVFHHGPNYFEVDIDVHRFSYTARLGLSGVRERTKDVVFDFGFVIEGHSDFELPENMLGAVRLCKLDLQQAIPFEQ